MRLRIGRLDRDTATTVELLARVTDSTMTGPLALIHQTFRGTGGHLAGQARVMLTTTALRWNILEDHKGAAVGTGNQSYVTDGVAMPCRWRASDTE